MGRRQDFHEILAKQYDRTILDENKRISTPCVKYQPGPSVTLTYPAIVYKLDDEPGIYADNRPYHWDHRYEVKVIDRSPDSRLREKIRALPMCRFVRPYVADNLHHFVFQIYY